MTRTAKTRARPDLTADLAPEEFRRWYYLKDELTSFARHLGLPAGGSKDAVAARIDARLAGLGPPPDTDVRRPSRGSPLHEPLSRETVIPTGQRCSQLLRAFFEREIGPSFRFDGAMRRFVTDADGRTLGEAVEHWHRTRSLAPDEIAPQFELNRFTREWHRRNPHGDPAQLRAAWRRYRDQPVDTRGRA